MKKSFRTILMGTLGTHFAIWEGTLASSDAHKPPEKVLSLLLNDRKIVSYHSQFVCQPFMIFKKVSNT